MPGGRHGRGEKGFGIETVRHRIGEVPALRQIRTARVTTAMLFAPAARASAATSFAGLAARLVGVRPDDHVAAA